MSGYRKSSHSISNGACAEAASAWRRSLHCESGACAEVGSAPGAVLVRDTTDRGGVTLSYPAGAWRAFLRALRAGERPS